eukprot:6458651-Amphidinium_carterae.1
MRCSCHQNWCYSHLCRLVHGLHRVPHFAHCACGATIHVLPTLRDLVDIGSTTSRAMSAPHRAVCGDLDQWLPFCHLGVIRH